MPYAYKKSERLKKNTEFIATMKGKRLSFDGLSLFYSGNSRDHFRVGISVSKRLANAVKRNKVRRQMRNAIMHVLAGYSLGYDLVFVARKELYTAEYSKILAAVEAVLHGAVLGRQHSEGSK